MPSLGRIFTSGLIASILAFTALGVAFASDGSDHGGSTNTNTTPTTPTTGGDDNSGDDSSKGKGKGNGQDPQPEHGNDDVNGHKGPGKVGPAEEPVAGKHLNAEPERGKVKVTTPGSKKAVDLSEISSIPVGSTVDVRTGAVKLTTPGNQWAVFSGGVFKLHQERSGRRPLTELVLRGGDLSSCGEVSHSVARMSRRGGGRRLWGRGKGHFRTRGRNGAATVRGTKWLTTDTCAGTLVFVKHGLVAVRDFPRRRTVMVATGQKYLAKAPKRGARPHPARSS